MWKHYLISLSLVVLATLATAKEEAGSNRFKKLLPVFQVVRFPNEACGVTGESKNGTCYTTEECSNKGGTSSGSCADGFGVCCICKFFINENLLTSFE
jgi:hypothetical protein